MKTALPFVHFVDNYLVSPTNPVTVNLIGAGGTGSQVLTALARISYSLVSLGHPGLSIRLFDDDLITKANIGRQLFAESEIGLPKSVALINRINRFFGTNWKAEYARFDRQFLQKDKLHSNLIISCVDTAKGRFEIAKILEGLDANTRSNNRPMYWIDFGNNRYTGQVILATIAKIKQPVSKKFQTVDNLPRITTEFKHLLQIVNENDLPSCSLAEALTKQDLFINTSLSALGASLLWSMFREGMIRYRGFFLNLKDYRSLPIPITK